MANTKDSKLDPKLYQTSGFDISKFKSEISNRGGLLKNNLYLAKFHGKGNDLNDLVFYTSSISIPSISLDTVDIRRFGYGPIEKVPYRPNFTGIKMDFYTDATSKSALFYALKKISGTINFIDYDIFELSNNSPYEISYKDNIKFDVSVYIYNERPDRIFVYTFRDCFIQELDGANLSWENQDQLLKTSITFYFTDFYVEIFTQGVNGPVNQYEQFSVVNPSGLEEFTQFYQEKLLSGNRNVDGTNSLTSLQNLLKLGTVGQLLSAIRRPQSVNDAINLVNTASIVSTGLGL